MEEAKGAAKAALELTEEHAVRDFVRQRFESELGELWNEEGVDFDRE